MECRHALKKGGRCEICGTLAGHGGTDGRALSSAREDGDAERVAIDNSDRGESRPRKEHLAASAALQGNGKPAASTKLDLHQTENGKAANESRKRRRKKAK
jgi:hypothetical protein